MVVNQSGISASIPTLLAYPKVLPFKDVPELKGMFCYVIEEYPLSGLTALVYRYRDDEGTPIVTWRLGDWDAHVIDMAKDHPLKNMAKNFMLNYSDKVLGVMQKIGLPQAQFYMSAVSNDLVLTDVRTHVNKLLGPGATIQMFSGVMNVQKQVAKPMIIDESTLDKIAKGIKPFNNNIILKPSAFKTITRGRELQPMYGLITAK